MNNHRTYRIDEASASATYIGEAAKGVAESSAFWRIRKIETSGTVRKILWADGNELFDNVWANRASLTYT